MSDKIYYSIVIVLNCIIAMTSGVKTCRYWCKFGENEFYCCPTGNPEKLITESWSLISSPMFWIEILEHTMSWPQFHLHSSSSNDNTSTKNKYCPPIRSICSRKFDWEYALQLCHTDMDCDIKEKCCFDICIDNKVCKPAE